jgi:rubrerythrin
VSIHASPHEPHIPQENHHETTRHLPPCSDRHPLLGIGVCLRQGRRHKNAAYAKKAKEEGYAKIAALFEAASKAEAIHAGNHRAVIDQMGAAMDAVTPKFEVRSTKENLEDAVKGESYEVATMYPEFIKLASVSKSSAAMLSFNYAFKTEQKHKELYVKALAALNDKKVETLPGQYFVCTTCGNTYDNEAAARCGICLTPKERFVTFQ